MFQIVYFKPYFYVSYRFDFKIRLFFCLKVCLKIFNDRICSGRMHLDGMKK